MGLSLLETVHHQQRFYRIRSYSHIALYFDTDSTENAYKIAQNLQK